MAVTHPRSRKPESDLVLLLSRLRWWQAQWVLRWERIQLPLRHPVGL